MYPVSLCYLGADETGSAQKSKYQYRNHLVKQQTGQESWLRMKMDTTMEKVKKTGVCPREGDPKAYSETITMPMLARTSFSAVLSSQFSQGGWKWWQFLQRLVKVVTTSSSLSTWNTSDFWGSTSSRSLRNWGAAVVGGRFLRTFILHCFSSPLDNCRQCIKKNYFTFSLLSTALRPLSELFSAAVGNRLGLNVGCLQKVAFSFFSFCQRNN